ncbi:MAG TPA: sigma 54-interacting transcriptional regulator [Puia sp.]|nr:sigma 54-interacting transcriptional regulator [Puia sp.]
MMSARGWSPDDGVGVKPGFDINHTHSMVMQLTCWLQPRLNSIHQIGDTSVLILGESGTGKEGIATNIHQPPTTHGIPVARVKTIAEMERDHILTVLRKCKGRISGTGGAAELQRLPASTLKSKIKKLGIERIYKE